MARKFLSFSNRFLSYANEAVLPFYILHHLVIICVGFYVIQWDIPVPAKYLLIIVMSFAIIMLTAGMGEVTCPITLSNVIVGDLEGNAVPVKIVNGELEIRQA
jgi:hypothetical protein